MSDIGEGVGGVIEGALLGGAVERERDGAGDAGHTHETACLNCGTPLAGPYCHRCGQGAHLHRSIGAIFHDLLHGVLHFEGRTFNTLPILAWKPGELTRRYIDGERQKFVSPMAMFLFSVFVMFAVFQIMGISATSNMASISGAEQVQEAEKKLVDQRKDLAEELEDQDLSGEERARIAERVEKLDADIAALRTLPIFQEGAGRETQGWHSGWKRLDKGIEKWRHNPGLMLYKLQTNAYKFSWLLIPISVPFVALVFAWRRRFGFYDHAVFVTYSIAFMSLMGILATIVGSFGVHPNYVLSTYSIIAFVHIYRHLKGTYELSHFSALWRTIYLMMAITTFILLIFVIALIMLGLVG
ncbi:hypothetical protein B2G71_03225 [Novosphingobium sp. PC22D]|uniref:DUF3667 domain-containing protein n=1 Tax=Novosphingobium sp. PC22D TaxID=1962403 RepID=UPI000BEFB4CB|nr:DUF3667 domain-containing protein [Novosphingobium sp. PC22D]PEQ14593.1 hypothetical protein B2G71_03225 [Novosphingobium sp. PC22D]